MIKPDSFPFIASFFGGIATFVSPCVLPLIPVYISFITGTSLNAVQEGRVSITRTLISSIFFILGFSIIFTLLGATATYLGSLFASKKDILRWIGGIIILLFGLHIMGILRFRFLMQEKRLKLENQSFGLLSSFLIGVAFAVGWTPCVGPLLGSILILASTQETIYRGILLLAIYSIGLGIPFLLTAIFINFALKVFGRIKKYYRIIEIISGIILVFVGFLLITGNFQIIMGEIFRVR